MPVAILRQSIQRLIEMKLMLLYILLPLKSQEMGHFAVVGITVALDRFTPAILEV